MLCIKCMSTKVHPKELAEADIRTLAKVEDPHCLSFFVGSSLEHNILNLKALVKDARNLLSTRGLDPKAIQELLAPVEALITENDLPVGVHETCVIFASESQFAIFVVALKIDQRVVVSNRFYLKPALPCLIRTRQFHVLAISENAARLYRCEDDQCHEVHLDAPISLRAVMSSRDHSTILQAHSSAAGGHGGSLTYHAHSGPIEDVHENRRIYCRHISGLVEKQIGKSGDPLILACVHEYLPLYREVNHYPALQEEAILGSPDRLTVKEIQVEGQAVVDHMSAKRTANALDEYKRHRNTPRSSSALREILRGTLEGRVQSVFVASDSDTWGSFNRSTLALSPLSEATSGAEEMTNLIALETLLHGGMAYAVSSAMLTEGESAAALFRY
jgi:hypothetical protein